MFFKNKRRIISKQSTTTFKFSSHIADLWDEWAKFSNNDVFLGKEFHQTIESTPPNGIKPYYCLVIQEDQSVGICYFQLKHLKLKEALKLEEQNPILLAAKKVMVNRINFYSLVCGNSMVTGQYGFRFQENIDRKTMFELASEAAHQLQLDLKKEDSVSVGPILFKDYYKRQLYPTESFLDFTNFTVQPTMKMVIDPLWQSFEDYLLAMKTKYRTRVKRAIKKLGETTVIDLDVALIKKHKEEMHTMYMSIATQASFNLFFLDQNYFLNLKERLGNNLIIKGYFDDDRFLGFYTLIKNNDRLDAHFLGYDKSMNSEKQLYLNMLYDMVKVGIEHHSKKVYMSRTALEIKSSVGAVSEEMFCYIKHTKPFYNSNIHRILDTLVPEEEWVPRSPFK